MSDLARVLRQDALYPHPERLVPFIGNHDTERFLTEADGSMPKLKLALGLLLTLRGMPQICSGDEIAMTGGKDPEVRDVGRHGCNCEQVTNLSEMLLNGHI